MNGKTDLVQADESPENVAITNDPMISMIERMILSPDVDANKMQQIIDMKHTEEDREAEREYNKAMCAAQLEMPIVPEDATNNQTNSTYSKYKTVLKYTKPIYTKHGFSISFYEGTGAADAEIRVMAKVMHNAGHSEVIFVDIPLDNAGIKGTVNKTRPHAKASSLSYGKGYLIKMVFNIPTGDDDDGNAAGGKVERISEEQTLTLIAKAEENGVYDGFIKWLKTQKVESINDIRADRYEHVNNKLDVSIAARKKNAKD